MREPEPPNGPEADEASASPQEHETGDGSVPAHAEDAVGSPRSGANVSPARDASAAEGQGDVAVEPPAAPLDPTSTLRPSPASQGHPDVPAATPASRDEPEADPVPAPRARPHVVWIPFDRDALHRIDEALATFEREGQRAIDTADTAAASHDVQPAPSPSPMLADVPRERGAGRSPRDTDDTDHEVDATPAVAPRIATARVAEAGSPLQDSVVGRTDEAMGEVSRPGHGDGADPAVAAASSSSHPADATSPDLDGDQPHAASGAEARRGERPDTGLGELTSTMPESQASGRHTAPKPVSLLGGDVGDDRADLAVFPFFVDERPLSGLLGLFDWRAAGRFTRLLDAEGEHAGAVGHALLTLGGRTLPARRVVLLGLGSTTAFGESAAELAAARIGDIVHDLQPGSVLFGATMAPAMRDSLDVFLRRVLGAAEHTPVGWFVCVEPRALARLRRRLEGEGTP